MSAHPTLAVVRAGEVFELKTGESLRPGDKIINKGTEVATVGTVSKVPELPSRLATLKPGQSVTVVDAGAPEDLVLGLEAEAGEAVIEDTTEQVVAAADFTVTPEVEVLEEATGLFGAVPFLAGGAGLAAAAGAIGLAALAGSNGDSDSDADTTTNNGMGLSGIAGGVSSLNQGIEQTPLNPITAVTGPVADGLGEVGGTLAGSDEPTGLGVTLGELVGMPVQNDGGGAADGGLVGLVNTVSTGLDDAISAGPLEPLSVIVDPLSQTLGGTDQQTDGVAQGLANVGSTLADGSGPLSPLTSDLLGPVVGTSPGQDGGLPQTLTQTGEGLTDLSNPESALAPLSAVTQPVSEQVIQTLADGVEQLGVALAGPAPQDPSGILPLVADLLGGEPSNAEASTAPASFSPLDALADSGSPGISSTAGLPLADVLTQGLPG